MGTTGVSEVSPGKANPPAHPMNVGETKAPLATEQGIRKGEKNTRPDGAELGSPPQALAGTTRPSLSEVLRFKYAQVLICPGIQAKHWAALITRSAGIVILMGVRAAPGPWMKGLAAGKWLLL